MKSYYEQNAVEEFQQRMRFLKSSRLYWCAVVVEWTGTQPAPWTTDPVLLATMTQQAAKALALEESKAVLMALPAGDMLVMGENISNAAYQRVKTSLDAAVKGMAGAVLHSYDLSVDWDAFLEASRRIYGRISQIETQSKAVDKAALLQMLDVEMKHVVPLLKNRVARPRRLNLLFVEDEPTIRQLLNTLMSESPHTLNFAANGREAVMAYASKPPHIVFLDINLPDISGFEVLDLILRHDPQAYVVMLTSHAEQGQVQAAKQRGVKSYIVKPFSRQKLTECLDRYYGL